jgi:cardiolipin synthase
MPAWRTKRATEFGELVRPVRERLLGHPNMFHPAQDPAIAPGVHLAEKLGDLPILGGNTVEVLTDYDGILDRLAADIDQAQVDVHLLFYIISDDPVAGRVLAALERAAKRGVACRVLADALGSRGFRYEPLTLRLRA